jgi:hypothetical protein
VPARHAVGVDLVEVALRQALGEDVPDEVALPQFRQPLAVRFFTAQPGPLPTGEVTRIGRISSRRGAKSNNWSGSAKMASKSAGVNARANREAKFWSKDRA